jgi:hypothetical protein
MQKEASVVQCDARIENWFRGIISFLRSQQSLRATQKIPSILCNPKVHYRFHKNPRNVPIESQMNSVCTHPSYLSSIHCNIILPSTFTSSYHLFLVRFSYQNSACTLFSHACYMPCQSCPPWLDYFDTRLVQVMKFPFMQFSPACYFILVRINCSP